MNLCVCAYLRAFFKGLRLCAYLWALLVRMGGYNVLDVTCFAFVLYILVSVCVCCKKHTFSPTHTQTHTPLPICVHIYACVHVHL